MFRDFVVNYKHIVVHARDISNMSRAVIDHQKDIVVMSSNKYVLTRYKTVSYSDLLMQTRYIAAKYMRNGTMYMHKGTMYMCKMGTLRFFIDATT